jgi:hypothetical protein
MLLYEQADPQPGNIDSATTEALLENLAVLLPTRFVYRDISPTLNLNLDEHLITL